MTSYNKLITYYANQRTRQLRELLSQDYGKHRITRNNEIYVYGKMPNSTAVGWRLLGTRREVENNYQL